jgi:hypothetical protein
MRVRKTREKEFTGLTWPQHRVSHPISCRHIFPLTQPTTKDDSPALKANIWYAHIFSSDHGYLSYRQVLQSQMIGMQSSLDRILSAVQPQSQSNETPGSFYTSTLGPGTSVNRDPVAVLPPSRNGFDLMNEGPSRRFLPLSGIFTSVSVGAQLRSI